MPRFRILVGQHAERDSEGVLHVYSAAGDREGALVDSVSDLLKLNSPGSIKFERVDKPLGHAETLADKQGRFSSPADEKSIPSTAPGGQVSTGFQVAPQTREGGVAGIHAAAAPTAEQVRAATIAQVERAQGRKPEEQSKAYTEAELHQFTVEELHELAADEEINLHGASKKEDIVKAIRKGQAEK